MVGRTGNSRTLYKDPAKEKNKTKTQNNQTHTYTKEKPRDTLTTKKSKVVGKKKGIVL